MQNTDASPLPFAERRIEDVPGHWLLARLGKRVLRPGGAELTRWMLRHAQLTGRSVVELAPGLGRTARDIVAAQPAEYLGIDADERAAAIVAQVVGSAGTCLVADAAATTLPDASADVVVGEAMLTMQGDRGKTAIIAEAARVLRPGGIYAIHELGLAPDDLDPGRKELLRKELARSIKVNARPLTIAEWTALLEGAGFVVTQSRTAPMALLRVRRNLADEGVLGCLRITANVIRWPGARKRVFAMKRVFDAHRKELVAVALIAQLPKEN